MEKDRIKFWYKQADRILTFEISRIICEEDNRKQSIMSNDLVIGRDNGNGSFRASLHFNKKSTSGRNITIYLHMTSERITMVILWVTQSWPQ